MPFDSNGVFTRVMNWTSDQQNGIAIECGRHDQEDDNFAEGFNDTFCRDGRAAATGNFNLGAHKIQNLADGTASTDAVNKGQLDTKANTTDVVNLTEPQTISGVKSFLYGIDVGGAPASGEEGGQINFNAGSSETNQHIFYFDRNAGVFRFFGMDTNGTMRVPLTVDINNNVVNVVASDVAGSAVSTVAKSKSSNGYFKLGNGLIIQWGRVSTTSTSEHTISFSTPFSSATSYTIVKNYQSNHSTDARDCEVSFYNMTATGATTSSPIGDTSQISWLAIGY